MKARDYLDRLEMLDTVISNKLIERQQWREIALSVTAHSDDVRVQTSGSKDKMANALARCVDMEREIDGLIDKLVDLKKDVCSVIEQLSVDEYDVLHKLYIQRLSFDEVAAAKNRSKSWVTTIHGRALQNVQAILNEREKENGTETNGQN